jgi:cbb3-type cytochrome oxidase subunit 3
MRLRSEIKYEIDRQQNQRVIYLIMIILAIVTFVASRIDAILGYTMSIFTLVFLGITVVVFKLNHRDYKKNGPILRTV